MEEVTLLEALGQCLDHINGELTLTDEEIDAYQDLIEEEKPDEIPDRNTPSWVEVEVRDNKNQEWDKEFVEFFIGIDEKGRFITQRLGQSITLPPYNYCRIKKGGGR